MSTNTIFIDPYLSLLLTNTNRLSIMKQIQFSGKVSCFGSFTYQMICFVSIQFIQKIAIISTKNKTTVLILNEVSGVFA